MSLTHCEWRVRPVARGPFQPCGRSLRYDTGDGVKTVVLYSSSTGRHLGPCHFQKAGEPILGQAEVMYPGWREFTPHVTTEEEVALAEAQRRFKWALTDTVEQHVAQGRGGLRRMDGSGLIEEWQPLVRKVE